MTIYTFGDDLLLAASVDFSLSSMTAQSARSAFNSMSNTSGPISEFWRSTITITALKEANWRALKALLFQLRGGKNLLRIYDPSAPEIAGAGGPLPTINIAADFLAGAETITLKNLTPSQAVGLAAGDYLGLGENLHMVVSDAGTDSSGECTVGILPAARQGGAEDDPVNTLKPTGLFRVQQMPSFPIVPGPISQPVQLEFMEDPDFG